MALSTIKFTPEKDSFKNQYYLLIIDFFCNLLGFKH